ncbi:odorant receptor Or2-like [Euwallacea fornicatus]|uniref:odorant receptor Or2-like n=1 Tax=Euwallacea fornicatus TaxID=995702 RepID=UPI003390071C
MSIPPRSNFLKIPIRLCSLIGIYPNVLLSTNNKFLQLYYNIYMRICFWLFAAFLCSSYVQLFVILFSRELDLEELYKNLIITPIFTTVIIRQRLMQTPTFIKLLRYVLTSDEDMQRVQDEKVIEIVTSSCRMVNRNIFIYLLMMVTTEISYTIRPLLEPPLEIQRGNITVLSRPIPLSAWFPFNKDDHFVAAYILNSIYVIFCSTYDTFGEILLTSILVYPTIQLRILHHNLKNFDHNLKETRFGTESAAFAMKKCIHLHTAINDYITDCNHIMPTCMFLDFFQSSVHMACMLNEMLQENVAIIQLISLLAYLVIMNFRLCLYYYYANEIMVLSQGLALAILQSEWYNQSPSVKFMVFMITMRSQKPLKYKLGIFGDMSLRTYLSILNAAYSYIMLMHQIQ